MNEFNNIDIKKEYEDPRMVVSIVMDRGDYEDFELECRHNHEKPTEVLRGIMESYAYVDEKDKLEERNMERFVSKGVDAKLLALYKKLCSIESRLDKLSNNETGIKTISIGPDVDEDAPFK